MNEKNEKIIKACINNNQPVLLLGETGTGKTTLIKQIADDNKKTLIRINLNGQTGREELIGKYILKNDELIWQDGILLYAIKKGYWLLLDEINASLPEVLLILQSLLEVKNKELGKLLLAEKDGEIITPHSDTRIFATANPVDYSGVKDFNIATLSRFVVVNVEPLNERSEVELLSSRFKKIKQTDIIKYVRMANKLRTLYYDKEISTFISTRDLEQLLQALEQKLDEDEAVDIAIINKNQSKSEVETVKQAISDYIKQVKASDLVSFDELIEQKKELEKEIKELKKSAKNYDKVVEMLDELKTKINNDED